MPPLAQKYKAHARGIMQYIASLGRIVREVGQCHLVLVSLIPSPDHNKKCKWAFRHFSQLLKQFALANRDVTTFCDVKPIFMKNHVIDRSLYNNRQRNMIHLNDQGATLLCKKVYKTLMNIENSKLE